MALDRNLKAFSRIDGMGRIVPGSTVLRKNKPKNGTWEENKTYQCCNTVTISYTVPDTVISNLDLSIKCGTTQVYFRYSSSGTNTAGDIVDLLNSEFVGQFPALGSFSTPDPAATEDAVINYTLSSELANIFCPYKNGLSFSVFAD